MRFPGYKIVINILRAFKVGVLYGLQEVFITLLQTVPAGPVFPGGGQDDLVVFERLDPVFQNWSIGFTENVGADFNYIVRGYTKYMLVVCCMADLAE